MSGLSEIRQIDTSSPGTLRRDLGRLVSIVEQEFRRIPAQVTPNIPFVNAMDHGAEPYTKSATAGFLKALHAMATAPRAGGLVGGVLFLPPGLYRFDTPGGTGEGTAIRFPTGFDYITIRGSGIGATILETATNEIELFLQYGGVDLTFEDLTIRNPAGPLLNQVKPASNTPGGGVAGQGNLACTAIRVAQGGGLRLSRVEFEGFTCDVDYMGNWQDIAELVGTVIQDDVVHRDCCFGLLAHQPEVLINRNTRSYNIVASVNSGGSEDPGHELYVTNRPGAHPKLVYVEGSYAENGHSSSIKIRKGELVIFNGLTSYLCGRGPEIWGAKQIIGSGVNTRLAETDVADTNASGLELADCGPSVISDVYVDINGCNAWGLRVRGPSGDGAVEDWHNKEIRLSNVTVKSDNSGTTGKAAVFLDGLTDMELRGFRFVHEGSIAATRKPIDARNCTRLLIVDPVHQANDGPSDAGKLASFDSGCADCRVEFSDRTGDLADEMITSEAADALAAIDRATPRYGVLLAETRKLINVMASEPRRQRSFLIDDTIQALVDDGIWDKLGALWVFAAHDEGAALINWRYPTFLTSTNTGGTSFTIDQGFTGNTGNTDRITLCDLSTVPLYALNDAHAAVWCEDGTSTTGVLGQNSTAGTLVIRPYDGTNFRAQMNDGTNSIVGAVADRNGMYVVNRDASTDYDGYKDGALIGNVVVNSTAVSADSLCVLRVGTAETNDRVLMASLGSALTAGEVTAFYTAMAAYFTDLGAI